MKILALDIGNHRIKVGMFRGDNLEWVRNLDPHDRKTLDYIATWGRETDRIGLTNVNKYDDWVGRLNALTQKPILEISGFTPAPIKNNYFSVQSLGSDRFAAAVGAKKYAKNLPALVIDVGTALTYEFVSADNEYLGGAISPGLHLRFRSLNQLTVRLPLVRPDSGEVSVVGSTTQECIRAGVQLGMLAEMQGMIEMYRKEEEAEHLMIFLTGGDMTFFENLLKNINFAMPNLVLEGIQAIVEYNVRYQYH